MDNYRRLKDFPTYIDESFYDLIDDIEIQRTIIREVISDILLENKNPLVTVGILVGILNRKLECSGAAMFLASRNFFRDSATLILTLMELRLDLEFIANDADNELKWISQERTTKKLWRVTDQIISLKIDENEKSADLKSYEFLSIIKHGNPAVGHLSFKIAAKSDKIIIDEKNIAVNPKLLLSLLSYQFDKSFDAVLTISKRNGIDLSSFQSRMTKIQASIKIKSSKNTEEMISEYDDKKIVNND